MPRTKSPKCLEPCACGCGQSKGHSRPSRYRRGHFEVRVTVNGRRQRLKHYAHSKNLTFALSYADLYDLLAPEPDLGASRQIRRIDPAKGFVPGNLTLVDVRAGTAWVRRALRTQLRRCARRDPRCALRVDDLLEIYERQRRACAVSGRPFRASPRDMDSDAISVDMVDPAMGYVPGNIRLVTAGVVAARGKWGHSYLVALAHDIVYITGKATG